jgi:hypothetical protein
MSYHARWSLEPRMRHRQVAQMSSTTTSRTISSDCEQKREQSEPVFAAKIIGLRQNMEAKWR